MSILYIDHICFVLYNAYIFISITYITYFSIMILYIASYINTYFVYSNYSTFNTEFISYVDNLFYLLSSSFILNA